LGWEQAAMISCVCGRNSASRRRSASSSIRWRTLDKDTSPDIAKLFATTYFVKSRAPACSDTTNRRGVLMIMSARLKELNGHMTKAVNLPTLSLTFWSARVAAVALLNNMIRHFRPWASLKHSLWIWCASSRVGAITKARSPESVLSLMLVMGACRAATSGSK